MTRAGDHRLAEGSILAAVRHFERAVGETEAMHRVSDRAERRARAQGERTA